MNANEKSNNGKTVRRMGTRHAAALAIGLALLTTASLSSIDASASSCWGCVQTSCHAGFTTGGVNCSEEKATCGILWQALGLDCSYSRCFTTGTCGVEVDKAGTPRLGALWQSENQQDR